MQRLSGKNFDVYLGDMLVHVESASLDIEDSSEVAKTNGIPNGWTDGEVGASGEIEVDAANLKLVTEAARNAGSFRGLPEFDILFYGSTGDGEESKIEAFGCKLKVSKLADSTPRAGKRSSSPSLMWSHRRILSVSTAFRISLPKKPRGCNGKGF